jgi:hypothetical protein
MLKAEGPSLGLIDQAESRHDSPSWQERPWCDDRIRTEARAVADQRPEFAHTGVDPGPVQANYDGCFWALVSEVGDRAR